MSYERTEATVASTGGRDGSLQGLTPLLGAWGPRQVPARIVHECRWTVGEQAMRVRESFAVGEADKADLDGTVFWSPERGRIEFAADGSTIDATSRRRGQPNRSSPRHARSGSSSASVRIRQRLPVPARTVGR